MSKTVNPDPNYITALVTKYDEKKHEVEIKREDGRVERFDPYVCAVISHDQTVELVGHYVKIDEPFYSQDGCMLCSNMTVIAKEGA